jgi:hypothetical protein
LRELAVPRMRLAGASGGSAFGLVAGLVTGLVAGLVAGFVTAARGAVSRALVVVFLLGILAVFQIDSSYRAV